MLQAALKALSINATPLAVESLFYDIDSNHSGEIEFKEFVAAISDEKMRVRTARKGRLYKAGLKGKKVWASKCNQFMGLHVDGVHAWC